MTAILLFASCGTAAVLYVPADFPTIQAAFDALQSCDTIVVASGTYAEELLAPDLEFTLKGIPDSVIHAEPVIDPSSLSSPGTRHCLRIPGVNPVTIEDITFRNGPAMYPRRGESPFGGVWNSSAGAVFRRCVFDSTFEGLTTSYTSVVLDQCRFVDNVQGAVRGHGASITATDCEFSGPSTWAVVWAGSNSSFMSCLFGRNPEPGGHLLMLDREGVEILSCLFGPNGPIYSTIVDAHLSNSTFEDNIFRDLIGFGPVINLSAPCNANVILRHNQFVSNRESTGLYDRCEIELSCEDGAGQPCEGVTLDDNHFVECDAGVATKAISFSGVTTITRNRFVNLEPPEQPAIECRNGSAWMRDNLFQNNGIALWAEDGTIVDAQWNWWGDSTGPYESLHNPWGRGDAIQGLGNVTYDPWHTDTSFLIDDVRPNPALVRECELAAYPNPFNTESRIMLAVREPVIVRVDVFDITGRMVRELFKGAVAGREEIRFDGSDLPSGIYFARASSTISRQPFNTIKLVLLK